MKKVFLALSFILSLLIQTSSSNAQTPVGNQFTVTAVGNVVTATLSGITIRVPETRSSQYKYIIDTKEITTIPPWISQDSPIPGIGDPNNPRTTPINGAITWTIRRLDGNNLKENTLYHVRVVEFPPAGPRAISFATPDVTVTTGDAGEIFSRTISVKKADNIRYELRGNITISKHKETDSVPLSSITVSVEIYDQATKNKVLSYPSVQPLEKTDGLFVFTIDVSALNPSTDYDLVVLFDSTTGAHTEKRVVLNTETGIPIVGKALDNLFDKNSYRLLAPIPGMVALLDPALCQQRQQLDPGQICDINAFLNFILKLIIGLAAVVLVVRLIIEGYSYMITDTPFKKAAAKGAFKEALIGLVIALSSYLILNTINPRLVNNDLKIGVASFDIDTRLAISGEGIDPDSPYAKGLSPEQIKQIKISYEGKRKAIKEVYAPARDRALLSVNQNTRLLMTAHVSVEGFYPGSLSYRTNNPGNIGNVGTNNQGVAEKRTCYATLEDGIKRQYSHIANLVSGKNPSYKIGRKVEVVPVAQRYPGESWAYDGSLWQYLYIYSPESPEKRNAYLSHVISFFASEGVTITRDTKMSEIFGSSPTTITVPPSVQCPAGV